MTAADRRPARASTTGREARASGGCTDADNVERVPRGRFAAPGDIAQAVAFPADPARSGFVTGIAMPVDGGWTADARRNSLRLRKR
ncbi:hypothetical protein [Streptomyces sp. NPDC053541]|uniref:hypothetical protein n=1 Tax=Streptomyces sp. NPDC053541 TaxID=3365709 RepID=UPI0037CF0828